MKKFLLSVFLCSQMLIGNNLCGMKKPSKINFSRSFCESPQCWVDFFRYHIIPFMLESSYKLFVKNIARDLSRNSKRMTLGAPRIFCPGDHVKNGFLQKSSYYQDEIVIVKKLYDAVQNSTLSEGMKQSRLSNTNALCLFFIQEVRDAIRPGVGQTLDHLFRSIYRLYPRDFLRSRDPFTNEPLLFLAVNTFANLDENDKYYNDLKNIYEFLLSEVKEENFVISCSSDIYENLPRLDMQRKLVIRSAKKKKSDNVREIRYLSMDGESNTIAHIVANTCKEICQKVLDKVKGLVPERDFNRIINMRNRYNLTPLHVAQDNEKEEIVQLLRNYGAIDCSKELSKSNKDLLKRYEDNYDDYDGYGYGRDIYNPGQEALLRLRAKLENVFRTGNINIVVQDSDWDDCYHWLIDSLGADNIAVFRDFFQYVLRDILLCENFNINLFAGRDYLIRFFLTWFTLSNDDLGEDYDAWAESVYDLLQIMLKHPDINVQCGVMDFFDCRSYTAYGLCPNFEKGIFLYKKLLDLMLSDPRVLVNMKDDNGHSILDVLFLDSDKRILKVKREFYDTILPYSQKEQGKL